MSAGKRPRFATHRKELPPKDGRSPLMGLLGLMKDQDSPEMERFRRDVKQKIGDLVEVARKKDVPHEVFEILCSLRDGLGEFHWFEKGLDPRPYKISGLPTKDHETDFGTVKTVAHPLFKAKARPKRRARR